MRLRLALLSLLVATAPAHAQVLLAQVTDNSGETGASGVVFPPATTFTPALVVGSTAQELAACLGCSGSTQFALNAATASVPLMAVVTASNTPGWNSFFAALSGTTDNTFWFTRCLYPMTAASAGCGSGAGGISASQEFGSVGAFSNRTVDFIDVTITKDSYTYTPTTTLGGSEYVFNYASTWQFWGTGAPVGGFAAPVPVPVPTPATGWLMLTGLIGLAAAKRLQGPAEMRLARMRLLRLNPARNFGSALSLEPRTSPHFRHAMLYPPPQNGRT